MVELKYTPPHNNKMNTKIDFEALKKYRHVSFDLWGTLIKSNPNFKTKRNQYLYNFYNPKSLSLEEIQEILTSISLENDNICTLTGIHIPSETIFARLLLRLYGIKEHVNDYHDFPFNKVQVLQLRKEINHLFLDNPPEIIDPDYPYELEELTKKGITLSYLSNTGFTDGSVMDMVLGENCLDILKYFRSGHYSSQSTYAKPSFMFYSEANAKIFSRLDQQQRDGLMQSKNIVHIGDNPIADYQGAINVGYSAILLKGT